MVQFTSGIALVPHRPLHVHRLLLVILSALIFIAQSAILLIAELLVFLLRVAPIWIKLKSTFFLFALPCVVTVTAVIILLLLLLLKKTRFFGLWGVAGLGRSVCSGCLLLLIAFVNTASKTTDGWLFRSSRVIRVLLVIRLAWRLIWLVILLWWIKLVKTTKMND
jgi:hypothetical protein